MSTLIMINQSLTFIDIRDSLGREMFPCSRANGYKYVENARNSTLDVMGLLVWIYEQQRYTGLAK